jgi:hypothetical protein
MSPIPLHPTDIHATEAWSKESILALTGIFVMLILPLLILLFKHIIIPYGALLE